MAMGSRSGLMSASGWLPIMKVELHQSIGLEVIVGCLILSLKKLKCIQA